MIRKIIGIFILLIGLTAGKVQAQDLAMPQMRSVSIDPATDNVLVKWDNPNDTAVTKFEMSRQPYAGISGSYPFNIVWSVTDPTATSWVDPSVNVPFINDNPQTYRMRAANATKTSPIASMHATMQLRDPVYSPCKNELEVRWTPYKQYFVNANSKIVEPHEPENTFNKAITYEVWGYAGTAPFAIANAVKLSTNTHTQTIDTLRGLTTNADYFLFVKAFLPNGDTATTYRIETVTATRREPAFMNIDSVNSVSGTIQLFFNIDKNTQLDTFALFRADITNRPIYWFRKDMPTRYTDSDIQVGLVYNYYLAVYRCGQLIMTSDTVNNVLLFANNVGQNIQTRWTAFTNKPTTYTLTRFEPPPALARSFSNQLTNVDDVRSLLEDGNFNYCYTMVANNGKSQARSEARCVTVEPVVSMPDAIDPLSDRVNTNTGIRRNQFGPILTFKDDKYRFTLEIYNKLGIRLFRSNKEFNDALSDYHYWDGSYNNKYVSEDVYIYSLKFEFKDKGSYTQNGTVTVVYR